MKPFAVTLVGVALTCLIASTSCALPVNLAPAGIATASSSDFGSGATDGIDGNRDGAFGNGSVWHTSSFAGPDSYMVDLGSTNFIDRIQLFPRTDQRQNSLENFRLTLFADDGGAPGAVIWTEDFFPAGSPKTADGGTNRGWATRIDAGLSGRFVKFERLDTAPEFTTFSEIEVWGSPTALPENLALTATVTADSPAAFNTSLGAINDGILNSDYFFNNSYIYHTEGQGAGQKITLELSAVAIVNYIQLVGRTDAYTTSSYLVNVLDENQIVIGSQTIFSPNNNNGYDFQLDFGALSDAKFVTVETLDNQFLAVGEVAVFGTAVPEPSTMGLFGLSTLGVIMIRRRPRSCQKTKLAWDQANMPTSPEPVTPTGQIYYSGALS